MKTLERFYVLSSLYHSFEASWNRFPFLKCIWLYFRLLFVVSLELKEFFFNFQPSKWFNGWGRRYCRNVQKSRSRWRLPSSYANFWWHWNKIRSSATQILYWCCESTKLIMINKEMNWSEEKLYFAFWERKKANFMTYDM